MRQRIALIVVAALATLAMGTAWANNPHYKSKVVIKSITDCGTGGCIEARGKVKSEHAACERKREVTLYYNDSGTYYPAGGAPVKTDSDGKWKVDPFQGPEDPSSTTWYAKVKKRVLGNGAVCKGDRSDVFTP
jgi:hypothetical protein